MFAHGVMEYLVYQPRGACGNDRPTIDDEIAIVKPVVFRAPNLHVGNPPRNPRRTEPTAGEQQ